MNFQQALDLLNNTVTTILDGKSLITEKHIQDVASLFNNFFTFLIWKDDDVVSFIDCAVKYFVLLKVYLTQLGEPSTYSHFILRMGLGSFLDVVDKAGIHSRIVTKIRKVIDVLGVQWKTECAIYKEILRLYSYLLDNVSFDILSKLAVKQRSLPEMYNILKNACDIETQAVVIEIIIKLFKHASKYPLMDEHFLEILQLLNVASIDKSNIYQNIRMIVDHLNESSTNIFSINCSLIQLDSWQIFEFYDATASHDIWLDVNMLENRFSFFCDQKLTSKFDDVVIQTASSSWEVISFSANDISQKKIEYDHNNKNLNMIFTLESSKLSLFAGSKLGKIRKLTISISRYSARFYSFVEAVLPQIFGDSFSVEGLNIRQEITSNESSPILEHFQLSKSSSIRPLTLTSHESNSVIDLSEEDVTETENNRSNDNCIVISDDESDDTKTIRPIKSRNCLNKSSSVISFHESVVGGKRPKTCKNGITSSPHDCENVYKKKKVEEKESKELNNNCKSSRFIEENTSIASEVLSSIVKSSVFKVSGLPEACKKIPLVESSVLRDSGLQEEACQKTSLVKSSVLKDSWSQDVPKCSVVKTSVPKESCQKKEVHHLPPLADLNVEAIRSQVENIETSKNLKNFRDPDSQNIPESVSNCPATRVKDCLKNKVNPDVSLMEKYTIVKSSILKDSGIEEVAPKSPLVESAEVKGSSPEVPHLSPPRTNVEAVWSQDKEVDALKHVEIMRDSGPQNIPDSVFNCSVSKVQDWLENRVNLDVSLIEDAPKVNDDKESGEVDCPSSVSVRNHHNCVEEHIQKLMDEGSKKEENEEVQKTDVYSQITSVEGLLKILCSQEDKPVLKQANQIDVHIETDESVDTDDTNIPLSKLKAKLGKQNLQNQKKNDTIREEIEEKKQNDKTIEENDTDITPDLEELQSKKIVKNKISLLTKESFIQAEKKKYDPDLTPDFQDLLKNFEHKTFTESKTQDFKEFSRTKRVKKYNKNKLSLQKSSKRKSDHDSVGHLKRNSKKLKNNALKTNTMDKNLDVSNMSFNNTSVMTSASARRRLYNPNDLSYLDEIFTEERLSIANNSWAAHQLFPNFVKQREEPIANKSLMSPKLDKKQSKTDEGAVENTSLDAPPQFAEVVTKTDEKKSNLNMEPVVNTSRHYPKSPKLDKKPVLNTSLMTRENSKSEKEIITNISSPIEILSQSHKRGRPRKTENTEVIKKRYIKKEQKENSDSKSKKTSFSSTCKRTLERRLNGTMKKGGKKKKETVGSPSSSPMEPFRIAVKSTRRSESKSKPNSIKSRLSGASSTKTRLINSTTRGDPRTEDKGIVHKKVNIISNILINPPVQQQPVFVEEVNMIQHKSYFQYLRQALEHDPNLLRNEVVDQIVDILIGVREYKF